MKIYNLTIKVAVTLIFALYSLLPSTVYSQTSIQDISDIWKNPSAQQGATTNTNQGTTTNQLTKLSGTGLGTEEVQQLLNQCNSQYKGQMVAQLNYVDNNISISRSPTDSGLYTYTAIVSKSTFTTSSVIAKVYAYDKIDSGKLKLIKENISFASSTDFPGYLEAKYTTILQSSLYHHIFFIELKNIIAGNIKYCINALPPGGEVESAADEPYTPPGNNAGGCSIGWVMKDINVGIGRLSVPIASGNAPAILSELGISENNLNVFTKLAICVHVWVLEPIIDGMSKFIEDAAGITKGFFRKYYA